MYSICFVYIIFVQILSAHSAPLLPFLDPYQTAWQQPQMMLQQQLMELQAQQWNRMSPVAVKTLAEPLILLLPYDRSIHRKTDITNKRINDRLDNDFKHKYEQSHNEDEEDSNAVVIEAEPSQAEVPHGVVFDAEPSQAEVPHRALLLFPNARLSLGEFISSIPFLPIEINVPDTISWAYNGIANGIASIISIIRPQSSQGENRISLKSVLNEMELQKAGMMRPVILLPMRGPVPF